MKGLSYTAKYLGIADLDTAIHPTGTNFVVDDKNSTTCVNLCLFRTSS